MKQFFLLSSRLCLLVLLFFSAHLHANQHDTTVDLSQISDKRVLSVGVLKENYVPYFGINDENQIGGIYPEYLAMLGKQLRLPIHYHIFSSAQEYQKAVAAGVIDIPLGISAILDGSDLIELSQPILHTPRTILIDRAIAETEQQLVNANNVKLAVYQNDIQQQYISQHYTRFNFFSLEKQQDIAPAITYGLANAHISDSLTNQYLATKVNPDTFTTLTLSSAPVRKWCIPLIKSNTALNTLINQIIDNTDPITMSSIVAKVSHWQRSNKKSVIVVNQQQQQWLKEHPVIRYTTLPDWHTIVMHNSQGEPYGLAINVLKQLASILGVKLEYVPNNGLEDALALLERGDVDLIPALLKNEQRQQYTHFSNPYFSTPWNLIVTKQSRSTLNDFIATSLRITSPYGDYARAIIEDYLPASKVIYAQSLDHAVEQLKSGQADAIFASLSTSERILAADKNQNLELLQHFEVNSNVDLQIGVNKQQTVLLNLINQSLDVIGYNNLEELSRSWIEVKTNQGITVPQIIKFALPILLVFFIIAGGILFWNQKLRNEVSFRKQAQRQAADAKQKLTSIADAIPGAVVQFTISNDSLYLRYASQGIEGLTPFKQQGLNETSQPKENLLPLLTTQQKDVLIEAAEQALKTQGGIDLEFILQAPFDKWLNLVAFPTVIDEQTLWSGVLLEVNQRKQQEFALAEAKNNAEQAVQAKSRFLAMMSHEIRTPLSGVIATSELLAQTPLDPQQHEDINTVIDSANNLLHILNDVLDHTKMEEQQFAIEIIECDLLVIVENAIRSHIADAQKKGIYIDFYFAPDVERFVETDPVRLQQVLSNLVSNAVKFTQQGTITIDVKVAKQGQPQEVYFAVRDSGIGISEENQAKLFTPFTQAESSTSRQFGGTGLGLSISQMLVNRLGGKIKINSALNIGSEFSFVIPLTCHHKTQLPTTPCNKKLVLLDDNSRCMNNIKSYFDSWNIYYDKLSSDQPIAPAELDKKLFIYHANSSQLPHLKQQSSNSLWVKLCELSEHDDVADHYLPTNPLLLTNLLDVIAMACQDQFKPLCVSQPKAKLTPQTKEQAIQDGRLILVAEDHPTIRKVLKRQIENLGYYADYTTNGVEALARLEQQKYDLLITDCHMPEMDGYTLTQTLRARGVSMPIIAFTANALTGEAERCLEIGMNGYISKPVSQAVLAAKLAKYLPQSSKSEQPITPMAMASTVKTQSSFDITALTHMFGEKESVLELLEQFMQSYDDDLGLLQQAIFKDQFSDIANISHRFKGACQMILATELSRLAEQLEQAAKAQKSQICQQILSQLESHFKVYQQTLARFTMV